MLRRHSAPTIKCACARKAFHISLQNRHLRKHNKIQTIACAWRAYDRVGLVLATLAIATAII